MDGRIMTIMTPGRHGFTVCYHRFPLLNSNKDNLALISQSIIFVIIELVYEHRLAWR